ncbi:ankyrin repeat protein [Seminavis robusta]|uniref:Ankyrin repeat protein n=1 Tax=Seminavis robusta TaxID=568900 RepID=A0A9N8EU27_9STRA|nr:ankyrin repeat protein [Seminavis robusta]|eukprot:Sro1819_g299650.1 ankyrin repeat protein (274) ;mRNA; f:10221-11199
MSSDSIATGLGAAASAGGGGAPAAAAANSTANNNKKQKMSPPVDSLLSATENDLLIQGILPFVGVGQYAFVGAVNKKMNQLYKYYCEIELKKNPRKVCDNTEEALVDDLEDDGRSAEVTDTCYSETFCNVPRAEYWQRDNSSKKTPDRDQVCTTVAKIGNLTVMKWARQKGFPWNEQTCAYAAHYGHLETLMWLHANGCPWDEGTCSDAAFGGHLEIIKWARANGCPWNDMTCASAALYGHLEFLKRARSNGCEWDELTWRVPMLLKRVIWKL